MDRASDSITAIHMLRELAEALTRARTKEEACQFASAVFQKGQKSQESQEDQEGQESQGCQKNSAGLPFALLYLLSEDGCQARLCGVTGLLPDSPVAPLLVDLQVGADPWSLAQVVQTGNPRLADNNICLESGAEKVLVVPIARPGQQRPYGALIVGIHPQYWLYENYHDFCFLAADQIAMTIARIENARLYQQSQEAILMRDELLASVSHDLKNPLGAIKGYTQLLQRFVRRSSFPEQEQLSNSLTRIDATTARMTALLNELMDLARAHLAQSVELIYGSLDYVALLRQEITEQQQMTAQVIKLETTLTSLVGRGDVARLDRVFSNLLSNAIKYDPNKNPVLITLDREEQDGCALAVIKIRDQGMGIPTTDLSHIFEQFHRAGNVGTVKGTGVGLSSAKQIVELHGGTIEVQSAEEQGSTFIVRLPLYPEES